MRAAGISRLLICIKKIGFKEKAYAEKLIQELSVNQPLQCVVDKVERKKENKILRFYLTWQNFRMYARSCLKSVRMKR